jgi:hypothetical protein
MVRLEGIAFEEGILQDTSSVPELQQDGIACIAAASLPHVDQHVLAEGQGQAH